MTKDNNEATENDDTKGLFPVVYNAINSESTNMAVLDLKNSDQLPEYKPENQNESMRLGGEKVDMTKIAIDSIQRSSTLSNNEEFSENREVFRLPIQEIEMLEPHPYTKAIPRLNEVERNSLLDHLLANGFTDEITLTQDRNFILDGCERINLLKGGKISHSPLFVCYKGNEANTLDFVMGKNFHRRHLSKGQRAVISLKLYDILKEQNHSVVSQRMDALRNSFDMKIENEKIDSRSEAAKYFGISPSYIGKAMRVKDTDPKLLQQVFEGEISLEKAYNQINDTANSGNNKANETIQALLDEFRKNAESRRIGTTESKRNSKPRVNIDNNTNIDRLKSFIEEQRNSSETETYVQPATSHNEDLHESPLDGFGSEYGVNKVVVSETISLLTKLGIHHSTAQQTIIHRIRKELEKKEKWSKQSEDVKFKKYLMDFMGFVRRLLSDDEVYKQFEARIDSIQTDKAVVQLDERIEKLKEICTDDEKKYLENSISVVNISMSEVPDAEKFETIITSFVTAVSGELK